MTSKTITINKTITLERCGNCDNKIEIPDNKPSICPECGKDIVHHALPVLQHVGMILCEFQINANTPILPKVRLHVRATKYNQMP